MLVQQLFKRLWFPCRACSYVLLKRDHFLLRVLQGNDYDIYKGRILFHLSFLRKMIFSISTEMNTKEEAAPTMMNSYRLKDSV